MGISWVQLRTNRTCFRSQISFIATQRLPKYKPGITSNPSHFCCRACFLASFCCCSIFSLSFLSIFRRAARLILSSKRRAFNFACCTSFLLLSISASRWKTYSNRSSSIPPENHLVKHACIPTKKINDILPIRYIFAIFAISWLIFLRSSLGQTPINTGVILQFF